MQKLAKKDLRVGPLDCTLLSLKRKANFISGRLYTTNAKHMAAFSSLRKGTDYVHKIELPICFSSPPVCKRVRACLWIYTFLADIEHKRVE